LCVLFYFTTLEMNAAGEEEQYFEGTQEEEGEHLEGF
jgi:hypothetical protein